MKFGPLPLDQAVGAVVAHALRHGDIVLKKGIIVTGEHINRLKAAGISEIVVALAEPGDVGENEAAERLAVAVAGPAVRVEAPFTGRSNLFAEAAGVLVIDRARIDVANAISEAITIATLEPMKKVGLGEMIATVKMIPFSVPEVDLGTAIKVAERTISVAPFTPRRVGVISTLLPGLKPSVVNKTLDVLDHRLGALGPSRRVHDVRVPHEMSALKEALALLAGQGTDVIIVFGASAISDRRDVIPAAIEAAGGRVEHLGMPVDPGNLLLIGELAGVPVIGAPGCARSPTENGFDWVLQRLCAGLAVTRTDIQRMGVGGLLMEIISRPQPRVPAAQVEAAPVAAVVLAAGMSTRMGANKLLEDLDGKPVVRHVVEAALASRCQHVSVVLGHQADDVTAALKGLDVSLVHNPDYADGMATSLIAGVSAIPDTAHAALVCLGDMPLVTPVMINAILDGFARHANARAVVPVAAGRRANPVLISRELFEDLKLLSGDVGARALLDRAGPGLIEVIIDDAAVLLDVDTPEALAQARSLMPG